MATFDGDVRKAVIPVAGLGTRFLPITKAIPKEMLPLVDRPAIEFVVREAVAAGCHDVLFIQGRGKTSLEDYFDRNAELEAVLKAGGDGEQLNEIVQLSASGAWARRVPGSRPRGQRAVRGPARGRRHR